MPLIQLIYVSAATHDFTQTDLVALLERSRRNNEPVGVTGLLLYRDGNFIQVLEGEAQEVAATHERIAKDPRHGGLITMLKASIAQRSFGDWSMGFRNLNLAEFAEVPGYSEFLNEARFGHQIGTTPDRALKLLQQFRKDMR